MNVMKDGGTAAAGRWGSGPGLSFSKAELLPLFCFWRSKPDFYVFGRREFDITAAEVGVSVLTVTSEEAEQKKHQQQNKINISSSSSRRYGK